MKSHRPEKLADLIRQILARLVREEVRDPRVGFVTLTEVRVSPDLRHARVFVSKLGDPGDRAASVAALNRAAPFLRRALASEARVRRTPEIQFVEDTVPESGARLNHLLDEIREDDRAEEGGEPPSGENDR
jgi:ribosome-binding factor A